MATDGGLFDDPEVRGRLSKVYARILAWQRTADRETYYVRLTGA